MYSLRLQNDNPGNKSCCVWPCSVPSPGSLPDQLFRQQGMSSPTYAGACCRLTRQALVRATANRRQKLLLALPAPTDMSPAAAESSQARQWAWPPQLDSLARTACRLGTMKWPTSSKMMGMPRSLQACTSALWKAGSGCTMPPAPCTLDPVSMAPLPAHSGITAKVAPERGPGRQRQALKLQCSMVQHLQRMHLPDQPLNSKP